MLCFNDKADVILNLVGEDKLLKIDSGYPLFKLGLYRQLNVMEVAIAIFFLSFLPPPLSGHAC